MENTNNGNQSVHKVLRVIEALSTCPEPVRLKDLAAMVGYPESSTLRLLKTLLANGYVSQNEETQKYFLTFKIVQIGSRVQSHFSLSELVRPYLQRLSMDCAESVCLAIEENGEGVYIDKQDGPDKQLQILHYIGKRAPMYCTGMGKNLLMNYTETEIRNRFAGQVFQKFTPNTVGSVDELIQRVNTARERGYALDDEECELGVRCIAAPIFDFSGKVVASISISGPTSRIYGERQEEIKNILCKNAAEISGWLRYERR